VGTTGPFVLTALVTGVIGLVLGVATVIAADELRAGRVATLSTVISRSLKVAVAAIVSGIAQYLVLFGSLFIAAVLALIGGGAAGLVVLVVVIVAGYIALRWSLSGAAIALEASGPIEALGRSRFLTKGNLWRIFGIFLVLALTAGPLLIGGGLLAYVIGGWSGNVVSALAAIVATPLFGIATATVFGDLTGRTEAPSVPAPNRGLRTGYAVALVALGVLALVVAVPGYGAAIDRHALDTVPVADRGVIYAGTLQTTDPCHPVGVKATFTSTDSIYLGGYFKRLVPAGEKATVAVYANGTLANSGQVGDPTRPTSCYRELDPIVGGSPGTYRLVVTYAGETIAEGTFTIQ